jgi:hypothetical protein
LAVEIFVNFLMVLYLFLFLPFLLSFGINE